MTDTARYLVRTVHVILQSTKAAEVPSKIRTGESVEATMDSAGILTQIKPTNR